MRTIIKLCICLITVLSFSACYPVRVYDNGGPRYHNRYEQRRQNRESRRGGAELKVRINTDNDRDRR